MNAIAFVGSTLPAAVIRDQIETGEIADIYTSYDGLIESYKHVIRSTNRTVRLSSIGTGNTILTFVKLIYILIISRVKGQRIIFYHECCWPMLDICIWLVRPRGDHCPQAQFDSMFHPQRSGQSHNTIYPKGYTLKRCLFRKFFKLYEITGVDGKGTIVATVMKQYPKTIKFRDAKKIFPMDEENFRASNTILILSGSDCASSTEMIQVYNEIVKSALEKGILIRIKDHPNKGARLDLDAPPHWKIDPEIPAELIGNDFSLVIGTASAAMARYGKRAVSIINLLSSMDDSDKTLRSDYIRSINPHVKFAVDINSIFDEFHRVSHGF